jgi:hypothetical protein
VLIRTRQAQGAGDAAYFVRLRRAAATSFWDFTNSAWQATEDADTRAYLTEYGDADANSLYAATITPPAADMVAEVVVVADNTVAASFDIELAGTETALAGAATIVPAGAVDTSVTVTAVISRAARGLGLVTADIADPYASTDPNILLMTTLLADLGMKLARQHSWQQLQREYAFQTVNGTASYSLPTDFKRLLDQTSWNRTADEPLVGGTTPQEWQRLKGANDTVTPYAISRIMGGQLLVYPTPTAAEDVYFEYQSRYWASATASSTVLSKEVPTVASDVLWFDLSLLVNGLKLAFRSARGLDASAESVEYSGALDSALGAQTDAPVLSLNGRTQIGLGEYGIGTIG